jgi:hypothetical protein
MQEWIQRSPVTANPRRNTDGRMSYPFNLDTAKRLLEEARNLPERPRARYRGLVYETLIPIPIPFGRPPILRLGHPARGKIELMPSSEIPWLVDRQARS